MQIYLCWKEKILETQNEASNFKPGLETRSKFVYCSKTKDRKESSLSVRAEDAIKVLQG